MEENRTRDIIEKEIKSLEKDIELEKSFNEHSGELSFMNYQLGELINELKELDDKGGDE